MDATAVSIVKVLFVFQKLVIDFPQLFVEAVFSGGTVVIFVVILATIGVLSVFDVPKFIVHLAVAKVWSLTQFYSWSKGLIFVSITRFASVVFVGDLGPCHQCHCFSIGPEAAYEARFRVVEGRCVSSKIPSKYQDLEELSCW